MRIDKGKFLLLAIMLVTITIFVMAGPSSAQTRSRAAIAPAPSVTKQPLYTDYKGVRLGMTVAEVRGKLGAPAYMDNELDYFALSVTETAQIVYDATRKVKTISVDYQNGTGAPEPAAVVGVDLETKANGSLYRQVRYDSLKFWVSYSRIAGPTSIVTITIQKI
ncbi:MAG: hypothetical protein M3539_10750 [Acidobacteriota bacterium]|nr:hypothetical protein [Acidobacteriota bacterium]